ncbi:hypothetical protein L917_18001 [Phytophthora nicotianae]|uniref:Uncharacterized protein n=3 Tax=Phytophthora nicotianae TaxID=4792 RepID=V9E6N7_PHYNI|nr:hypothetical protein F443_18809 [Phytophthora nicotianae P1569]ETK75036.1 hypothetical protein L915_18277 [Phytophthora nicotianae]ETO63495.1 hypothetical protein F444_18795 [Phytophthora nicotianae P1976]ETL28457.1 hypothetical protein L916_18186 [Phytophthora nicotianae]ETL81712.1 hypothetical protein L917_18001 [Phytophthora nicotianae]
MEVLLRAADERISWNSTTPDAPKYVFLPGIYTTVAPQTAPTQPQHQEDGTHDLTKIAPLKSALSIRSSIAQLPSSPTPVVTDSASEGDGSKIRIILHGDNTFEYVWTMKRSGVRAMEFAVEMEGRWTKPVLNRTRRGQEDQRVILSAQRIRFQRLSNYESTGAALPAQILSNSPACRILAGLTKKIANKLGAPVDVMTEKWLPARGVRLALTEDAGGVKVKQFNPFYCLADTLRSNCQSEPFPSTSA